MAINTANKDVEFDINPRVLIPFYYATPDFDPDTETKSENLPSRIIDKQNHVNKILDNRQQGQLALENGYSFQRMK